MSAPSWSDSIRRLYLSGAANQFILHGNVSDRLLVPGVEQPTVGSLPDFLTREQFKRFDLVLGYKLGAGVQVLAGEALFRQIAPAGDPPIDPAQAIGWIDHVLRTCVNLRGLTPSPTAPTSATAIAGRNLHIAVVIGSADLIFPVAKQVRDYALNSIAAVVPCNPCEPS